MTKQIYDWGVTYEHRIRCNKLISFDDVYSRPSTHKKIAWNDLLLKCKEYKGWALSIVQSSNYTFTAAFSYRDHQGDVMFHIESPTKSIDIYPSELRAYEEQ